MADIVIVVKIPEEDIEYLEEKYKKGYASRQELALIKAVAKGHILPKGHGVLIDKNEYFNGNFNDAREFLDKATTIIEADKEEEDE